MLTDIDESLENDLVKLFFRLYSAVIFVKYSIPLIIRHICRLRTCRFCLVIQNYVQLISVAGTQFFAEHALERGCRLGQLRVQVLNKFLLLDGSLK